MTININSMVRREFPNWNMRGRIRKVDEEGNVLPGQYAFNGEVVRISPRFQRNGLHYRVRPERPATFFAAWCYEQGLLPSLLTPAECQQEWALELLDSLWEENKYRFHKLESPFAASDTNTVPSHRVGFSFNILQILVEESGAVRTTQARPVFRPNANGTGSSLDLEAAQKRIEEMRARAAAGGANGTSPTPGKKKKGNLDATAIMAALHDAEKNAAEPTPE